MGPVPRGLVHRLLLPRPTDFPRYFASYGIDYKRLKAEDVNSEFAECVAFRSARIVRKAVYEVQR